MKPSEDGPAKSPIQPEQKTEIAGRRVKIYLIARIWPQFQLWNEEVCSHLPSRDFDVFIPHRHNPHNLAPEKIPLDVAQEDNARIDESDVGLVLPPFGKDCSFEVGRYAGRNSVSQRHRQQAVILFTRMETRDWLKDWMVRSGLHAVVTDNNETYETLQKDRIAREIPLHYLPSLHDVGPMIRQILNDCRATPSV